MKDLIACAAILTLGVAVYVLITTVPYAGAVAGALILLALVAL
jgi:hypothetical protein